MKILHFFLHALLLRAAAANLAVTNADQGVASPKVKRTTGVGPSRGGAEGGAWIERADRVMVADYLGFTFLLYQWQAVDDL